MSNNKSSIEWLIDNYFGGIENCSPMFRRKIAEAKAMHKEEFTKAYYAGYHRALELVEWKIKSELKIDNNERQ